ncbi:hypothetical protein WJX81_000157 [Elliptochloris bilobata]|uniref:Uncharacterized protein n=1 Tax=Elliptochloris bilobata TaxID=381761 RepID=A0AAW1REM3_9CHLO
MAAPVDTLLKGLSSVLDLYLRLDRLWSPAHARRPLLEPVDTRLSAWRAAEYAHWLTLPDDEVLELTSTTSKHEAGRYANDVRAALHWLLARGPGRGGACSMAGLAALCAAAALLHAAGVGGQSVPGATTYSTAKFSTNYGVSSPPVGYGWGNGCYLNKVAKVIVTVQANDPVSAIDPTPGSAPAGNPCGAFPAGFVTSPSWNAFLNCTCPIAGTGAGRRRRALLTLDQLVQPPPQHQATGVVVPGANGSGQSWSDSGASWNGGVPQGGFKFFGECKQNLLTLQATCNFVFDYSSRRLLDVLSKIQPAGGVPAGGTVQFQFCSINLGGSVVTSATCFESYGGNKPVIVKIASRAATDVLPPIGFNACYTDQTGSPNKCLVFTIAQSCANSVQPSYSDNVPSTIGEAALPGITHDVGQTWSQSWGPTPPSQAWGGSGQSWGGSAGGSAMPPPPGHFASAGAAVDSVLQAAGQGLSGVSQMVPGGGDGKQAVAAGQAAAAAEQGAGAVAGSGQGSDPVANPGYTSGASAARMEQATPGAPPQVPAGGASAVRPAAPVTPSAAAVATATGAQAQRAQPRAPTTVTTTVVGSAGRRHLGD